MKNKYKIYQAFYREDQERHLNSEFQPLDVTANARPLEREFPIIKDMYDKGLHKECEYTGLVAHSFLGKMNSEVPNFTIFKDVFGFMHSNSGYDVYLFNPFFGDVALHKNVWRQGEGAHPRIAHVADLLIHEISLRNSDSIFQKAASQSVTVPEYGVETYSMCNYWVGNKKFWDKYMDFVGAIYNFIFGDKISEDLKKEITGNARHRAGSEWIRLWLFPFIIERMTSTLICLDSDIKSIGWQPEG